MSEYIVEMPKEPAKVVWDGWNIRIEWQYKQREEIVRCRDCKHMHTVYSWLGMDVDECWLHADPETGALGKNRTEPDGFCAWGERRTDGNQ